MELSLANTRLLSIGLQQIKVVLLLFFFVVVKVFVVVVVGVVDMAVVVWVAVVVVGGGVFCGLLLLLLLLLGGKPIKKVMNILESSVSLGPPSTLPHQVGLYNGQLLR